MRWAKRFGAKLAAGYLLLIVVVTACATAALVSLAHTERRLGREIDLDWHEVVAADSLRLYVTQADSAIRGYALTRDPSFLARSQLRAREARQYLHTLRTRATRDEVPLLDHIDASERRFSTAVDRLTTTARGVDGAAVNAVLTRDVVPARTALDDAVDRYTRYEQQTLEAARGARAQQERDAVLLAIVVLVIGVAASTAFALTMGAHLNSLHASVARSAVVREELMHSLAHDLRSPLQAIRLKAASLARRSEPPVRDAGAQIGEIVIRMDALIGRLLDIASFEGGGLTLALADVPVDALLAETENVYRDIAAEKAIHLACHGDAGLVIRADRPRVAEVLSNLVGNAVRFAPPGGHVDVAAAREDGYVCFDVVDDGPGLPPANGGQVFDRFYRAGSDGHGLGLYIAKGIVEAHGGHISADGAPGGGARFRFTIPAAAD